MCKFKDPHLPKQRVFYFEHYDSKHLYATDGLTSQAHTTIYPAWGVGGSHSIHLSWDLKKKNPNSPWEGLISAGVPSSSTTPGVKGAKRILWVWEKESREKSARADLVQLTPVPHWSSRTQGISKPTAQPREHVSPINLFSWIQNPSTKSFIWLPYLSLSAAFWESGVLNLKLLVPFKLRQTQGAFVSLRIKFLIFQ